MDQVLAFQLNRSKILIDALEVAKVSDNPLVEQHIIDIRRCINKSQLTLDKIKTILERKKEIYVEMDDLAYKFENLAKAAENINDKVFANQSFNSSTPKKNDQQSLRVEQSGNGLEVSPCPATWYNGILDSPMPPPGHNGSSRPPVSMEVQIPCIRMLHSNEMNSVPAYMKGRLTCENVNSFISIVNSVLKQKYSIALLKRKEVKRKDLVHYSEWKSQEQEFGMIGKAFFTTEDLLNFGNQKIDKVTDKMIQILRHCNRLRQTRANKKVVIYSLI
ncbi:spindle and kinetochore-associated protein 1-like [Macrosteles quadrilineatus]|uniref:spindle and kinetochore-associated protein 1-like n=1 Tax=Macrosteles quadrilineatus TaxID=74068 RepID=UPI0023E22B29|nr:spindle and kinetochore-associated protein 1-like [Macrosteles quadrilineatus]